MFDTEEEQNMMLDRRLKATRPAAYSASPLASSFHTITMAMHRAAIAASVLSAWGALASCTSDVRPDTYLQQEVMKLQERTIPADSHLVSDPPPVIQGWVALASWEFESSLSPGSYNLWVTSRLEPDFRMLEAANSPLRFSRYTKGDVEAVSIDTASASGTLHVTVKVEIYPD
jgi:hypothetical protein